MADPEAGGRIEWRQMTPLYLKNQTFVVFDDEKNILMAGRRGDSLLLTIPTREGISLIQNGKVNVPIWNNSAIFFR